MEQILAFVATHGRFKDCDAAEIARRCGRQERVLEAIRERLFYGGAGLFGARRGDAVLTDAAEVADPIAEAGFRR